MGLQYSITGIGSVILQTAVNGLGSIYVASMTAGSKINIFLACPFDALGQTMAPYAGQNIGARKLDRVGKGLRAACIIGFIVSGLMVIVVKLFGDQLTMLFLDEKDPVIMQNSTQFLYRHFTVCLPWSIRFALPFKVWDFHHSPLSQV